MTTEEKIFLAFEELFDIKVSLDSTLKSADIDSLDLISCIQLLEQRFDISVPDSKIMKLRRVRDIVNLVDKLLLEKDDRARTKSA